MMATTTIMTSTWWQQPLVGPEIRAKSRIDIWRPANLHPLWLTLCNGGSCTSATCILYSTSVTAMVASGFHEVRWTLLFIICLTQLMTQSRVVPRVGTVTLALWLTSTIAATTLLQLAHWLTSRAQRGSCPQIILCSPLFGFFWRVCDYAKIDPETSQNEILPSFRYAISWCGTNVRKTLSFNLQMRFWRKQSIANLPFSALAGSELPELVKTKVPISRDLCNRPPERQ